MKKNLVATLITTSLILSVVGCGSSSEKTYTQSEVDKMIEAATIQSEAVSENEDSSSIMDSENIVSSSVIDVENGTESSAVSLTEVTAAEEQSQTVIDNDDILVEYRGISEHSSSSWIINLYIENKASKELYVDLEDVLVNDCNVTLANNNVSIPAESKYLAEPNFNYIIDTDKLAEYGITKITDITFVLSVKDEWAGDSIYEENVSSSLAKVIPDSTGETAISNGQILIENEDVVVSYCGINKYSDSSWILNLYMENNSDSEKYLDVDDLLINGYSIQLANGNCEVPAHCKYLASPCFDYVINVDDLDAYGISDIESIDFKLNVKKEWAGKSIYSTPVNLK